MGFVPRDHAAVGTRLKVIVRGKRPGRRSRRHALRPPPLRAQTLIA